MAHRVTLIPGDGTGPELTEATRRVLEATGVDVPQRPTLRLDPFDQLHRLGLTLFVLDTGVQVFGVLTDDHKVDVLEPRADPFVGLARAHLGVEVERLPQANVDRAKAAADRRRDRPFDCDSGAPDRVEGLLRQWIAAELVHHIGPRLLHVPVELDARRLEDAARRLAQLRTGAVARDESHFVSHGPGAYPSYRGTRLG